MKCNFSNPESKLNLKDYDAELEDERLNKVKEMGKCLNLKSDLNYSMKHGPPIIFDENHNDMPTTYSNSIPQKTGRCIKNKKLPSKYLTKIMFNQTHV